MKKVLLASVIGCLGLAWCLGCETGEYLEDDADFLDGEEDGSDDLSDRATSVGLYQAEKFTAQSGCKIATNQAGYTGTGFVDFGANGTWMELNNVNVAQAGSHTLKFRFATASGSRQCAILINGTNVGNVSFSSTGAWTKWGTASLTKSLKAGNNTIRILANTSSGGPNLDSMEVLSEIVATGSCVEAAENKTAALSCPSGKSIVAVNFASYGLPTGACPGGFATSACHSASSMDKVKAACLNKQSCSVAASNGVFGDPCSGQAKKLAVVYTCGGSGPIDNCPNDPNKTEPGQCGCGVSEGSCNNTGGLLDRASNTKLRIASWNVFRGSVFPKTDATWRAINNSGKYQVARTEGGTRIFQAVKADIWLLQETVYSTSALPAGITANDINNKIAQHMRSLTGDAWSVKCNVEGLCIMIRGALRFGESWNPHGRVAGNRVILPDGSTVLMVNVHYMTVGNAETTASLIKSAGSSDAAVFVGGDFNDSTNGPRYNVISAVPSMSALSMFHLKDPKSTHLSPSMVNASFKNTGGQVVFDGGPTGQDILTAVNGGTIDHFFLRTGSLGSAHRFILNSMLLSPETLRVHRLTPLDVALEPQAYQPYFKDFVSNGIVHELPSTMRGIGHDHLPMVVDLTSR